MIAGRQRPSLAVMGDQSSSSIPGDLSLELEKVGT